jgi:Ni,Fe-hydrogenase III component G
MSKIDEAKALLGQWSKENKERENRLDILIEASDLMQAVGAIKHWGYFSALIGLDEGEGLAVLYVFCEKENVLCLKVLLPRENPHLPSLCPILPAAQLQERELQEMFGISIDGIPDKSRLLLPDDWPESLYPLRKDAILD